MGWCKSKPKPCFRKSISRRTVVQSRGLLIDVKHTRNRLGGYYEHPEIDLIREDEEAKSELVFSDETTGYKIVNVDHIAIYEITNSASIGSKYV